MDSYILPSTIYDPETGMNSTFPSPPAARRSYNLIKETNVCISPVNEDDFPTPRAVGQNYYAVSPVSDPAPSPEMWRKSRANPDFDDLYDVTDDEGSEVIALTCSASVKKILSPRKNRFPSIVIPSPTSWPQPPSKVARSPAVLSMIAESCLQVPVFDRSSTPSLDGSLSSDDLDKLSCPGTPDSRCGPSALEWASTPLQLSAQALQTLHQISETETETPSAPTPVVQVSSHEMLEVTGSFMRNVAVDIVRSPIEGSQEEPLSALSVPSPGGFFSSLEGSARNAWAVVEDDETAPSTSAAENFYGVPWASGAPVTQTIDAPSPVSDGPSTARQTTFSTDDTVVDEIRTTTIEFEYNEDYQKELEMTSSANIDRTSSWLYAQESYLSSIRGLGSKSDTASEKSHSRTSSDEESILSIASPSKKSVRFADALDAETRSTISETLEPQKETMFLKGFKQIREHSQQSDVFVHGRARAEAIHTERRCLPIAHRNRLQGKYEVTDPVRSAHKRPVSHFYTEDPSVKNDSIAQIQKERQVLEQIQPQMWTLDALKTLNGGRLVSQPAHKWLSRKTSSTLRVLDLAGPTDCEWAWQMAMDYPNADIYNVNVDAPTTSIQGPDNYFNVSASNLWTLPFPAGHFDVISARTLHAMLKLHKPSLPSADPTTKQLTTDEYDLCLTECQRLLKKGGFLEFSLIDAEMVCPRDSVPARAQALPVEFAFNLRTRGYDSQPTAKFLPRLHNAGFNKVKRSWLVLPVPQITATSTSTNETTASGSTADASCITGLVGAAAWERWMLKLQMEMGKEEERLLEGVADAMEQGAAARAGWRYLSGWARKQ